jgi:hypothetical protein
MLSHETSFGAETRSLRKCQDGSVLVVPILMRNNSRISSRVVGRVRVVYPWSRSYGLVDRNAIITKSIHVHSETELHIIEHV